MSRVEEDMNLVPATLETPEGEKHEVYFYKPQNLVFFRYATLEFVEHKGCKVIPKR